MLPKRARLDEVAGFLDHRVARVVVSKAKHQTGLVDKRGKFLGFIQVERGGLVRHDVKARLERCLGDPVMGVVRRRDHHEVHAVVLRPRCLRRHQFGIGTVAPFRIDAV